MAEEKLLIEPAAKELNEDIENLRRNGATYSHAAEISPLLFSIAISAKRIADRLDEIQQFGVQS